MTEELRLDLDLGLDSTKVLGPLIDPNVHSCGTVRPHTYQALTHPEEVGFFTVGAKSYGRAPTFLMATGYEQVGRSRRISPVTRNGPPRSIWSCRKPERAVWAAPARPARAESSWLPMQAPAAADGGRWCGASHWLAPHSCMEPVRCAGTAHSATGLARHQRDETFGGVMYSSHQRAILLVGRMHRRGEPMLRPFDG